MSKQTVPPRLSNLQLELLKLFHYELPDQELLEIKELLARYFAQKVTAGMDLLWENRHLTNATMDDWLHEHHRTPYQ